MKNIVIITLIVFCDPILLSAQGDTIQKIYKTWIILNDPLVKENGILYAIKDSTVLLASYLNRKEFLSGKFYSKTINYKNINIIKTRNKNSIINRSLIGIDIGTTIGALIGHSQGDDPPCKYFCLFWMSADDKATIGGILGAFAGAGFGALSGLITIKIPINGNIQKFNENRNRLKKYTYNH